MVNVQIVTYLTWKNTINRHRIEYRSKHVLKKLKILIIFSPFEFLGHECEFPHRFSIPSIIPKRWCSHRFHCSTLRFVIPEEQQPNRVTMKLNLDGAQSTFSAVISSELIDIFNEVILLFARKLQIIMHLSKYGAFSFNSHLFLHFNENFSTFLLFHRVVRFNLA